MKNLIIKCSLGSLLVFLALVILVPVQARSENDVATALYKEGLKKLILEDYNGAVKDFDTAYRLNPEDIKIRKMYINTLIKLGNTEYENNNLKMAEKHFLKAYSLSGEDGDIQKNLKSIQDRIKEQELEQARLTEQEREQARLKEQEKETVKEVAVSTKEKMADEPYISEGLREEVVQPPFNMEEFVEKQSLENEKILAKMIEAQKTEREILLKNVEESQKILNDNIKEQKEERAGLLKHIRESQDLLIENVKGQKEERTDLFENIEANQRLLDENIKAQKEERISLIENIKENQKVIDENIKAQLNDREMLFMRMEENQRLLDENIKAQRDERETFLNSLMALAQSQSEDRKLFSRSLTTLVGGGIVLTVIIFVGLFILFRRRTSHQSQAVYHDPQKALEYNTSKQLEYTDKEDETEYITDENYSDMVRAKRLRELYLEFQKGNPSWEVIQGYISELNHEVKSEILSVVEKKVVSGEANVHSGTLDILLPFITDGDNDIRSRGKGVLRNIIDGTGVYSETEVLEKENGVSGEPLTNSALLSMAKMVDTKTGRIDHSLNVADIASRITIALQDPDLDPEVVKKVGLAHDLGFLEIDDKIPKTKGEITKKQFEMIKTHPKRGIDLLRHLELPALIIDGIKYHHERLDGSGYPEGLKNDRIPLIARVLAVADVFDAVTSVRPYRPAINLGACFKMMKELAGTKLDQKIFDILVGLYDDHNTNG